MSALSRFGPTVARSAILHQQRHMATASASTEPVQKLFLDKIREFKASNKGLDENHQKAMSEEFERLRRVYRVEDENKLTQFEFKFPAEHQVSLHDIDDSKEKREQVASGEYQKQLAADAAPKSALLASIPEQVTLDLHLPPLNKPDEIIILETTDKSPQPLKIGNQIPDYEFTGDKMTPQRLQDELLVKFGPEMPTIHDDKAPERDVVNFPRLPVPLDAPPTRFHFVPESWFQIFYPKTGVTGPFAFATTFGTFLFSKEWLVWEHELLTGVTSTIIFTTAVIKFGPKVSEWLRKGVKDSCDGWEHWRTGTISSLGQMQNHYKNELNKADAIKELYAIRQQDIEVQLEGEYRSRLKTVYDDTKRRLEYLVAVANSQRQIAHKNMVNWVISNAVASFGSKQEGEVLDNCIVNLKQLASKNANAI